jgi:hypothetical protein
MIISGRFQDSGHPIVFHFGPSVALCKAGDQPLITRLTQCTTPCARLQFSIGYHAGHFCTQAGGGQRYSCNLCIVKVLENYSVSRYKLHLSQVSFQALRNRPTSMERNVKKQVQKCFVAEPRAYLTQDVWFWQATRHTMYAVVSVI